MSRHHRQQRHALLGREAEVPGLRSRPPAPSSCARVIPRAGAADSTSLIGKFGVGFYSVFMTCDSVRVTTRRRDASTGYLWSSDGSGTYTIQEASDAAPGTSVCMMLRQDCKSFAQTDEVQRVLLKYSNFINFPVHLNGARINTIDAIWTKDKASISEEDHVKFFQVPFSFLKNKTPNL